MEQTPVIDRPWPSFFKRILKFFFWIILLFLLAAGALLALLLIYEDEVKAALVKELNKHLKSEVRIDPKNIDLTIIKTFPDCSIEFKDLLMLEALPIKNRDTLLFAGQLNLHFNIRDLWNKNYQIQKIKLKDGIVKLRVLKDGKSNYLFWETSKGSDTQKKDSLHFDLKAISIEDCRISYRNKKTLFKTSLAVKSLSFKGKFREENFELGSDASLFIEEIVQGKTNYLRSKKCTVSVELDVSDHTYAIKKAKLDLNKLGLELSGKFVYADSLERMEIKYNAPDLEISSLLSLLPETFKEKIGDYESTGNFYAGGTFRYLNKENYSLVSNFGIRKGQVIYKPHNAKAEQVNIEGYLNCSNKVTVLDLKDIHLNLNSDEISGHCLINNFSDPYLKLSAKANAKLENIFDFWPIDTLSSLKGNLQINTEIEGLLSTLKSQTFSEKVKLDLEARISKLEAQFKGDEKHYVVENCFITAKERNIEVKDLKLKRGSSDLILNGKIPGVFNYIMDKKAPLVITGSLYSEQIRLEDFIQGGKSSSGASNSALIPSNMNFKLNVAIVNFSFGKFGARSITGELDIKDQKAMASDIRLETMQGEASIDAFADNSKGRLDVTLQSNLKEINIQELFAGMNNFGQSALTDKNIKGLASATLAFSGRWNNQLVADPQSIQSTCNLLIERGELNDFKPLQSLSRFVDVEELKRVKFSSLQSAIEIRNSAIIIPKTSIKNSALDVEIWGTHYFDNRIDYHIQLLISQYLAKKRKSRDTEFGPVENDPDNKRSAFILMTGTLDDPKIKYDTKGLKEKIRSDIKAEKTNLKQVLKEEWKLFKKDSSLKKNKEEPAFELEKPQGAAPKKTLEPKRKEEEDDDF